jgi:hypothetical protein
VPDSGVGLALRRHPRRAAGGPARPLRIGVTGLGAGGLAAYADTNDLIRFYEINPAVIACAGPPAPGDAPPTAAYFTYLADCPGTVQVVPGDARLSLEQELRASGSQRYDVLVLDAFSSDSVPVHLLTLEAFETYRAHLRDRDSIIAVNVSNRFLDLRPLIFSTAARIGMHAALFRNSGDPPHPAKSVWVLLTHNRAFFEANEIQERRALYRPPGDAVWTDAYSDLFRLLRWK